MKRYLFLLLATASIVCARSTPDDWHLDVQFPSKPSQRVREMPLPNGMGTQIQLILNAGDKLYAITRMEFPADIPPDRISSFLEVSKDNVLRDFSGTPQIDAVITIMGYSGRKCVMIHARGKRKMDHRAAVVGRFVYTLLYDAPVAVFSEKEAEAFFPTKEANQPVQRNAGSRPSSADSPASATPSTLAPRG
jgi:hypothetical protein